MLTNKDAVNRYVAKDLNWQIENFLRRCYLEDKNLPPSEENDENSRILKKQLEKAINIMPEKFNTQHDLLSCIYNIVMQDKNYTSTDNLLREQIKDILDSEKDNPLNDTANNSPVFFTKIKQLIEEHYIVSSEMLLPQNKGIKQIIRLEGKELAELSLVYDNGVPNAQLITYENITLNNIQHKKEVVYKADIDMKSVVAYFNGNRTESPLNCIKFDSEFQIESVIAHCLINNNPAGQAANIMSGPVYYKNMVSSNIATPESFNHEPKLICFRHERNPTEITMEFNSLAENKFTEEEKEALNIKVRKNNICFKEASGVNRPGAFNEKLKYYDNDGRLSGWGFTAGWDNSLQGEELLRRKEIARSACAKLKQILGPLIVENSEGRKGEIFYSANDDCTIHSHFSCSLTNNTTIVPLKWHEDGTVRIIERGLHDSISVLRFGTDLLPSIYNLPPLKKSDIQSAENAAQSEAASDNNLSDNTKNNEKFPTAAEMQSPYFHTANLSSGSSHNDRPY